MAPKAKKRAAEEYKKVDEADAQVRKAGRLEPSELPDVKKAEIPKKEEVKDEKDAKEEKIEAKEEKFEEPDAPKDSRPANKAKVVFNPADTTLNVLQTWGGKVLTTMTEGGMGYLLAGARANVSIKAGRYMFEVKIVQSMATGHTGQKPKQVLRVGVSTSSSSLILGDDAQGVCFDSDGFFTTAGKRSPGGIRIAKGMVIAIVVNLDSKSPNFNTIAMYKDGQKISEPKPLPEALHGKPLFPHVTFRNCSVQMNFGPLALKELPFQCRLLQSAAASDLNVPATKEPKDGKYEVVMPVGFPDEGTFDWLDMYLEQNPQYVELSDRKIIDWAKSSGFFPKGGNKASNDRPQFSFGIPAVDDMSVRKVISAVAPVVPRNYMIMEVKSNLLEGERKEMLKRFNYPCYKKVAHIVMGPSDDDFRKVVHSKLLKEKQAKADIEWKKQKAEQIKQKAVARSMKEVKKKRKAAEKAKAELAKKQAAEKKAKEDEAKAKLKAEKGEDEKEEPKEEEEEKKEEPKEEEESEESEPEAEDKETEPPAVELDDEEEKVNFLPKPQPDLTPQVMAQAYGKFSIPEKDEGFDEMRFEWSKAKAAKEYLKTWVTNKKRTTRIEDIKPGVFFKEKSAEFSKLIKEWQAKLKEFKATEKDGEDHPHRKPDFDIFTVADVQDAGTGVPLFERFAAEDWILAQLRFELYILIVSFPKDADDPDRDGIPLDHLAFYFTRYFNRPLSPKKFGVNEVSEVIAMIPDTVSTKDGVLSSQLADDLEGLDIFVKLAEEHRRERQRRIDAGDETARLNFNAPAGKPAAAAAAAAPAAAAAKSEKAASASAASPSKPAAGAAKKEEGKPAAPKPAKAAQMPSVAAPKPAKLAQMPSVAARKK